MIAIVDYAMGNLHSVKKAFERVGAKVLVTSDPEQILRAEKLVLPGVGAFPDAMKELRKRGLIQAIKKFISSGMPYLGICLGLQLLLTRSEEGKGAKGLDIIRGTVKRFRLSPARLKVPHIGWNQIQMRNCPLFKGIPDNSYMYFVHSYYADPEDKSQVAAVTDYGIEFASLVFKDNIFATQFHPEKSQQLGLRLLENFVNLK